ncbi:MAG: response regulator [Rubricoccaceae bacterium]|nr:response regulator [Rubricoccaceae bacterium]
MLNPDPAPSEGTPGAHDPLAAAVPDLGAPIIQPSEGDGPEAGSAEEENALVEVGPSVLVVEDNEDTRALLSRLLQRSYRVRAVADALSALDLMNHERFDALILDINLGGKQTGIDVLRIARTISGYEDVFAVALTAYALPGDRDRFLEAGFNRYVSKPFTRATLMEALTEGVPAA